MEQKWGIGEDLGIGISEFGKVGAFEMIGAPSFLWKLQV